PWFRYSAHLLGVAEASFLSSISPSSYLHNKTACRLCRQAEREHCLLPFLLTIRIERLTL
ncbi:hypothetical protein, partial [Geobacillus thermodenitrificans]|uniref:hypothetical protein n=1 Tax=Geobacillus thermodenitrificans TaxID=33940 RepID=UPI002E240F1D|nr:hypothetical protein [Geobacillus thermodenitrificans]